MKRDAGIIKVAEKGVIPVLDAGIHLRKSLCCKEIDYRVKPDNDNFRSFSVAPNSSTSLFLSDNLKIRSFVRIENFDFRAFHGNIFNKVRNIKAVGRKKIFWVIGKFNPFFRSVA